MNKLRPYITRGSSLRGGASSISQAGNALLYVLLAVGLLAALTYSYAKDSRENYAAQSSIHIAEELFAQINMIRAAVIQCTLEYPGGGGDMNCDGVISASDNPNNPYPLNPSNALNLQAGAGLSCTAGPAPGGCTASGNASGCIAVAGNDNVRNLACIGAPAGTAYMFQGTGNEGRFLPPPPSGFSEWTYVNNVNGVYIQITAPSDAAAIQALNRLMDKFTSTQANISGLTFTAWIQNNT